MIWVLECVECGRRFEDAEAFELHIKANPHERDGFVLITIRSSKFR